MTLGIYFLTFSGGKDNAHDCGGGDFCEHGGRCGGGGGGGVAMSKSKVFSNKEHITRTKKSRERSSQCMKAHMESNARVFRVEGLEWRV